MEFSWKLTLNMTVSVELMSCSIVDNHWVFGGTYRLHLQGTIISHLQLWPQRGILCCSEDKMSFVPRNVGNLILVHDVTSTSVIFCLEHPAQCSSHNTTNEFGDCKVKHVNQAVSVSDFSGKTKDF